MILKETQQVFQRLHPSVMELKINPIPFHRSRKANNNIHTNVQLIHKETHKLYLHRILCITAQYHSFKNMEANLTSAFNNIGAYYNINYLRDNPNNTHTCAFHLRNQERERERELKVSWCRKSLQHYAYRVYLGSYPR